MPIKYDDLEEYCREVTGAVLASLTVEEIRQLALEMERKKRVLH
jgi:hypothetical protein